MQKPYEDHIKSASKVKQLLFGHPFIHRMLKDMIKADATRSTAVKAKEDDEGKSTKLKFSSTVAKILLKHFEEAINGRGVFILLELIENEATSQFVSK